MIELGTSTTNVEAEAEAPAVDSQHCAKQQHVSCYIVEEGRGVREAAIANRE